MSDDNGFDKPDLCAYWEEISPTASGQVASGQLAASVRRLSMVVDELQGIKDEPELEIAVRRLEYHLESYYTRVFMLRDRAINLLGARVGDQELAKKLKADLTTATRRELNARSPDLTPLVEDLTSLLRQDSKLRNMHTHECYLRIGLRIGATMYDVEDSLLEADDRFRELCQNLIGKCVEEYVLKASAIVSVVMQILEADKRRM